VIDVGKYFAIMRANWSTLKAYRVDLLMRLFTVMPMKIIIAFALWTILFQASGLATIGGLTYVEFLLYYTIQAVLGLAFGRSIVEQMTRDVLEGELIITMSKPVRYPIFQLAMVSAPAILFVISGGIVGTIAIIALQLPVTQNIVQWIFFGFSVIIAFLVYYLMEFLIGSLEISSKL